MVFSRGRLTGRAGGAARRRRFPASGNRVHGSDRARAAAAGSRLRMGGAWSPAHPRGGLARRVHPRRDHPRRPRISIRQRVLDPTVHQCVGHVLRDRACQRDAHLYVRALGLGRPGVWPVHGTGGQVSLAELAPLGIPGRIRRHADVGRTGAADQPSRRGPGGPGARRTVLGPQSLDAGALGATGHSRERRDAPAVLGAGGGGNTHARCPRPGAARAGGGGHAGVCGVDLAALHGGWPPGGPWVVRLRRGDGPRPPPRNPSARRGIPGRRRGICRLHPRAAPGHGGRRVGHGPQVRRGNRCAAGA